jgi:uncharacterized protein YbcI
MNSSRGPRTTAAAQISTEMVRLLSRYTGRGPTKARATVNTNLIVVIFQDTLTKAEHNLVAAGETEAVHYTRRTFRQIMRQEAVEIVERVTGRTVIGFMSDIDPEANVASEVFLLDPLPEDGTVGVAYAPDDASESDRPTRKPTRAGR